MGYEYQKYIGSKYMFENINSNKTEDYKYFTS